MLQAGIETLLSFTSALIAKPHTRQQSQRKWRNFNAYVLVFALFTYKLTETGVLNSIEEICISQVATLIYDIIMRLLYIYIYIYELTSFLVVLFIPMVSFRHFCNSEMNMVDLLWLNLLGQYIQSELALEKKSHG